MHYEPTFQQLLKELYTLLSSHYCIVLPVMLEKQKFYFELFNHKKGLRDYSVTVFNLKTARVEFHNSCYNKQLKFPCICLLIQNPLAHLHELTEPKNRIFCLNTLIESYQFLMHLPKEELHLFNVAYVRFILEKDGSYHPYLHRMYISEFDADGNPWLITTETMRLTDKNIPEFRYFSPASEHYTEDHEYSLHLLNIKLKEQDKVLLKQYRHDCKKKKISEKLHRSTHTISNFYTRIEKTYKVHSIHTACEITHIMDLLTKEWYDLN